VRRRPGILHWDTFTSEAIYRRTEASGSPRRGAAAPGAEIVCHVGRVGRGDDRGHALVAEQEFEKELRPALSAELLGPVRQVLAAHGAEEPAAAEGQRGQHRSPGLGRERQQALLSLAVIKRVCSRRYRILRRSKMTRMG
jgi:hypothetical protein